MYKSFRIGCKGLSETPSHFIFRYKGDSVGRYRRYPLPRRVNEGVPLQNMPNHHKEMSSDSEKTNIFSVARVSEFEGW